MGSTRSYLQTFTLVAFFCQFWTVEGARPEVHGKVSGVVELECRFPSSDPTAESSASPHVIEWMRQGLDTPVLLKFGSHAPRIHPQYEGRVSLVRITTLRLEGLQLDDQGLYECRILLLDKPADELQNGTWTLLTVAAPPTFVRTPPPVVEGLVGRHLSLFCVAQGNPQPTITWLKDDEVIERTNDQEGVLSLRSVNAKTAGQYTCHASNSEGNVTLVTKVKIKGPPVIVVPPKSASLNMSQNAHLRCQAVADPPNMTYVWQKDGKNVYHIESLKLRVKIMVDGTLLITSLNPEDSGSYTCMPTNGLGTSPTASANLTVTHPAKALKMPGETYLPTGMDGVVSCPTIAQPPLLRVLWTKDGEPLDLSLYPGWTLMPEGSLFMATVNDDAPGVYICTPYNSYGSMGPSEPTKVILQDPPSFSVTPEKRYEQEVGRTLLVPCEGNKEPTLKISWSKVDFARRTSYSILSNGSLLLQPVSKDHQGMWECQAANRVASVKATTQVFVLGTSPHAATSLSVSPGVTEANISWEAGFDGGSEQTFSVWVKKIPVSDNDAKQDWFSVPVPHLPATSLQVTGLSPATDYQFSVLSYNKMGTGPFSEIAAARTLDPLPRRSKPKPPTLLSANRSSAGIVLQWSPPEAQNPPITSFVLQSRTEQGEWINLDRDVGANRSEIVVLGLHKDCVYELRLLSRHGELLSEPSPSVNVSTVGMEMYPSASRLLEFVPEPLLVGVLGGVVFMCVALLLLVGSACIINHRRERRRKKRKDDPPPSIYKCSPSIKTSGTGSTDSVLKKSLLPASTLYPTTSSTTSSSSSSQTDCSTLSTENHQQRTHLLSGYTRGRLTRAASSPLSPSIELISRGPDGRFSTLPCGRDVLGAHSRKSGRSAGVQRSLSLHSEQPDRKEMPFVLSVDLPLCKLAEDCASGRTCSTLPRRCSYISDQKANYAGLPDISSVCSTSSLATIPYKERTMTPTFPVLPHIRSSMGQPLTTASTLVLQMEHERERGNLSRCLKLAQEREEMERELQRYILHRGSKKEMRRELSDTGRQDGGNELVWEYKSRTLPHRHPQGSKENFGLSPNLFSSSSVHWGASPLVSKHSAIRSRSFLRTPSPSSPSCFLSGSRPPAVCSAKRISLQSGEADGFSEDRLTLPILHSKHQQHERVEAAPEGYDNSPQSTVLEMQTNDSCSEAGRQHNLSHGSLSTLFFHSSKYTGNSDTALQAVPVFSIAKVESPGARAEDMCAEMSVDEPEVSPQSKPMLHHRIASHVQQGHTLPRKGRPEDLRRSTSFQGGRGPRAHASPQHQERDLRRTTSVGSKRWEAKQRSQSLDSRRREESVFLTPDAWIDSLNQGDHSEASFGSRDPRGSPTRNASRSSADFPSANHISTPHPPPAALSPRSSPLRATQTPDVLCDYKPRREPQVFPSATRCYQEAMREAMGYLEEVKASSGCFLPDDGEAQDEREALEMECGSSYSSYASSGRGSMEAAGARLSLCHLPTGESGPPDALEDGLGCTEDNFQQKMELSQRKPSVDENYEWDAADICSQPGDHDGLLPPLHLQKPASWHSRPSTQRSTKAMKNLTQLPLLGGHQSSCSAEAEPDPVLF